MRVVLAVTMGISLIAALFAVWPAVGTAPWEQEETAIADNWQERLLCQAALEARNKALAQLGGEDRPGGAFDDPDFETLNEIREIAVQAVEDECR